MARQASGPREGAERGRQRPARREADEAAAVRGLRATEGETRKASSRLLKAAPGRLPVQAVSRHRRQDPAPAGSELTGVAAVNSDVVAFGSIKGGRLFIRDRRRFDQLIAQLREGSEVEIEVTR